MNFNSNYEIDIYYAWLASRLGAGSAAFKRLIGVFKNGKNIFETMDYSEAKLTEKQINRLLDKGLSTAKRSIDSAIYSGFIPISYESPNYPQKLKEISNPPPIFYIKGKIPDFDTCHCVGLVGTRKATKNALRQAKAISCSLSQKGVIIISGLALGIDSEAHYSALDTFGLTAGISGVKAGQIYPKENDHLYQKMYENGTVICEHSPTDNVEKGAFPIRNRIISALSDILIMVEAPEKSGALITAEKSLSLKKEVYVPKSTLDNSEGGRLLLEKGAKILYSENDILDSLNEKKDKIFFSGDNLPRTKQFFNFKSPDILDEEKEEKLSVPTMKKDACVEQKSNPENEITDGLSEMEKNIYKYILNHTSVSTDQIIKELNISSADAASCASMLEIYGFVRRMPGDKWSII